MVIAEDDTKSARKAEKQGSKGKLVLKVKGLVSSPEPVVEVPHPLSADAVVDYENI